MGRRKAPPSPGVDLTGYIQAMAAEIENAPWSFTQAKAARPRNTAQRRPGSIHTIEPVRRLTSLKASEGINARRCSALNRFGEPCRMVAVRDSDVCFFHGGAAIIRLRRREQGLAERNKFDVINTTMKRLQITRAIPAGLTSHPLYAKLARLSREDKNAAARHACFQLIQAYTQKDVNPSYWVDTLVRLEALDFRKRPKTPKP